MNEHNATQLLHRIANGDTEAFDHLFPIVYHELKSVAHSALRAERQGHTLNTTALVHEAYLKLVRRPPPLAWQGRQHFFAVAAKAMRQLLIDYARARNSQKRGAGQENVPFDEEGVLPDVKADELIALDEALGRLEVIDARLVQIVEHRFFAGYTIEETSQLLGCSVATVNRDWISARLWLNREIRSILGTEQEGS